MVCGKLLFQLLFSKTGEYMSLSIEYFCSQIGHEFLCRIEIRIFLAKSHFEQLIQYGIVRWNIEINVNPIVIRAKFNCWQRKIKFRLKWTPNDRKNQRQIAAYLTYCSSALNGILGMDDLECRSPELPFDEIYVIDCAADKCGMPSGCCMPNLGHVLNPCCKTESSETDQKPSIDDNCWKVCIDVSNFQPEDITVSSANQKIIVNAKQQMGTGLCCLSNEFTREYELPAEFNPDNVVACFSCDCILIITVPRVRYQFHPIQPCGPARCFATCKSSTDQKIGKKEDGKKWKWNEKKTYQK